MPSAEPEIQGENMIRERAFKAVLVVVGLFFTSLVYPVALDLRHLYAEDPGDTMMKGLYVTLGISCC